MKHSGHRSFHLRRTLRHKLRHILPDVEHIRTYKILHIFGERLFHPALWGINRHTVAKAVAIGCFCGLIPGPLQVLGSSLACVFFRGNLPLAVLTTFYTNPFTIVPLYFVAYHYGAWVLGNAEHSQHEFSLPEWTWHQLGASIQAYWDWGLSLGAPLALGIFLLAATLAATSYLGITLIWNWRLRQVWHRRRARHAESNNAQGGTH